ncbi:hypothetical protein CC78DRAFT_480679 [Lojkania enalia]|uniref:N-acetyltransferase domain-containing protein n=1 Tax=Lojkania enalia TaxID=147567 RepID=A0A9P4JVJ8_9PLEO|nr:hypothetical protein CC78DRAFT_480679 [Didymosphaeria enalia]
MIFLSHINYSDIDSLVRNIDFPAMQDGPLYRVMFPENLRDEQRSEIIEWYTINMQRAFSSSTTFCKACTDDGEAVGFAGWVWEGKASNNSAQKKFEEKTCLPQTLDVAAWQDLSKGLMKERRLLNLCSLFLYILGLTFVSVRPDYQKEGIGSTMMEYICKEADQLYGHLYVLASPAGVNLYSKFGFKTVGQINTKKGVITSMLRKADEGRRVL